MNFWIDSEEAMLNFPFAFYFMQPTCTGNRPGAQKTVSQWRRYWQCAATQTRATSATTAPSAESSPSFVLFTAPLGFAPSLSKNSGVPIPSLSSYQHIPIWRRSRRHQEGAHHMFILSHKLAHMRNQFSSHFSVD